MNDKMKTPANSNATPVAHTEIAIEYITASGQTEINVVVNDTIKLIENGLLLSKKGWQGIMLGALRLIWLQKRNARQGARNDLVPSEKKSGFNIVLDRSALPSSTAYRWMQQARGFLSEIGLSDENIPSPGTDEWARMQKFVVERIDVLIKLKLPMRANALPAHEEIITRLRVAAEAGDKSASDLIDQLEAGDTTMGDATRRYCGVDAQVKRPVPAMLKLDSKTLKPTGQMMKALDTVERGFIAWDDLPAEARIQATTRIREVFAKIPGECKFRGF